MEQVLGPHARTDRTRDTRVAEPWLPAQEDERPGEGQRLTPDAPHNGGRPPPGTAPHHPHGTQLPQGMQAKGTVLGPHTHTSAPTARGWQTPTARRVGGQSGEGGRLTSDAPHNGGRHLPPGTPFRHPHSEQRRPARVHAVEPVLGPHARTDRTRNTRVAVPRLPAPEDGRSGEGQRLTPDAPHNGCRPAFPGDGPTPPPRHAAPTGRAGQGDSVRPPHPHARARSTWVGDPSSPPSRRAVGGGGAPDLRRPSQRWKAPSLGMPFRHPHSEQRRPAKGARCGTGAGSPRPHRPHPEHTGRGTPAAHLRGRAVGGGRAPDTRRRSQQWQATPPQGRPPTNLAARSPHRACRPSQVGRNRDRTAPPEHARRSKGPGQDTQRGMNHVERP